MSLSVVCPDCTLRLSVPDSAAGELVVCPKCDAEFEVAADSRRRPTRDEDDEDERPRRREPREEDEADEDRPRAKPRRKKRRPATAGGSSAGLWVGLAVGAVVLAGAGVGAYFVARSAGKKPDAAPAAAAAADPANPAPGNPANPAVPAGPKPPPGWVEFRHPQGLFVAHVPAHPSQDFRIPRGGPNDVRVTVFHTEPTKDQPLSCTFRVMEIPPHLVAEYRRPLETGEIDPQAHALAGAFGGGATFTHTTWAGRPAFETVLTVDYQKFFGQVGGEAGVKMLEDLGKGAKDKDGRPLPGVPLGKVVVVHRATMVGDRLYDFSIGHSASGQAPSDADRRAFFDSVVFLK